MRTETALDFIDFCATEEKVTTVINRFLDAIAIFGFDACAAGAWIGVGGARIHRFYFNTWPSDWADLYETRGYFEVDPFVIECRRRMSPFLLTEMARERTFTVEGKVAYEAAINYGWAQVMGVPIHGPAGYQGLVALASRNPLVLTERDRSLLRIMAMLMHDRARASIEIGLATMPVIPLTPREIDCMRWVAEGKTDVEIGVILGISTATAHFHVERVKAKAQTRSRAKAVALLVLAGTI